jgi:hypothetical protein
MPSKKQPPEKVLAAITESSSPASGEHLLIYGSKRGVQIEIRYEGETLWMTQNQIAELFGVTRQTVNIHLNNIYNEKELDREATCKEFLQVQTEGDRKVNREVLSHSLDAIISVGYRVSSAQATQFRIWATERLKDLLLKGWSIDVARMKDPASRDHLKELKETIRDIRASEANLYREVRSICALCQDYDPQSEDWRNFYMGMQNRLLWAICQMTGPEIILSRADATALNMGLSTWANDNIRKSDVTVANNYLSEPEIREKNRLTTMLLDYFEDQVDQGRLVSMAEAETKSCDFIKFNDRPLLRDLGRVRRDIADEHAQKQYEMWKENQRLLRTQGW